jgi:hypothetical protein
MMTKHEKNFQQKSKAPAIIATIELGHATRLRISLSTWCGSHRLELRLATAQIQNVYVPTSDGFSIDVAKLPELIAALRKAEAPAASRQGGEP